MSSLAVRFALALGLVITASAVRAAAAADLRDHAESLHAIPADAAFYGASLKYGEQLRAMLETNAWKKLMTIPGIQLGLMQAHAQWQFPSNPQVQLVKEWVESEDGQDVLSLAKELAAEEVFVYGDGSWTTILEVLMKFNSQVSQAPWQALQERAGVDNGDDEEEEGFEADVDLKMQRLIEEFIDQRGDELNVPDLVIGFRVDDRERAVTLLDRFEEPLREALEGVSIQVADLLKRRSSENIELLTMTFSADQLPWGQIEEEFDGPPETLEKLKRFARDKQAVLAVGVVEDFVVVSVGDSTAHLAAATDGPLLAERDEFDRLNRHADESIVSIGYVSGDFLRAANSNEKSFNDLATMGKGFAGMADLDDDRRAAIEADIDELKEGILAFLPEPGSVAGVTFTTDRGYESYGYNWGSVAANLDATKPLTLVDRLGAESLGWLVARGKQSVEQYDKVVDWVRRGRDHFEAIMQPRSEPDEWLEYTETRDALLPLLARLNDANRELVIPAMADGQTGLVIDASLADEAWHNQMPEADSPLPLPTIAIVYSVSDADKLKQAAREYSDVAGEAIELFREMKPDQVPAFEIPSPSVTDAPAGKVYSYTLPGELGVSDRVAPSAALSEDTLALSLLPELSESLLDGPPPELDGPAADFDRPLLSAAHFKIAKLIDLTRPWIDYGIKIGVEQAQQEGAGEQVGQAVAMIGFVKPQVDQLLDVLQAFDSWTGVTYRDDGAWVTHGELRIIDLDN